MSVGRELVVMGGIARSRPRLALRRVVRSRKRSSILMMTPNGPEMSRPASQDQYRAKAKRLAGRVGSIELLGVPNCCPDYFRPHSLMVPSRLAPPPLGPAFFLFPQISFFLFF